MIKKNNNKYDNIFITTTDTITGIGCPINDQDLQILYEIKQREIHKRILILVGSIDQAREFKSWSKKAEVFAHKFWPGGTTLILDEKIGLRLPNCDNLRKLLLEIGPCYMTSANISKEQPLSFEKAIKTFSMIKKHYNFCLGSGKASQIIDVRNGKILRNG